MKLRPVAAILAVLFIAAAGVTAQLQPTPVAGLDYDVEFFPGTSYDASIPTPEQILGFRLGDRAALPAEIGRALEIWSEASPRAELVEYARSYEGRPLHYLIVSSPRNLHRIDQIREGLAQLADPRELDDEDARLLVNRLPATAWLAYSIHGDETSGTDGALAVAYHLIAAEEPDITALLDEVVVLIDPMMNPDGRHRFLQQIAEHRATTPNLDNQSLLHSGYWPWGRGNHYLFDLNRDWILGVNPETRGRIRAAARWHPLLFVDAHEMGPLDTYLFSPAREPRNPNFPPRRAHWQQIFARDQAAAFDRYNWKYYTGEWNEGWYPGYSDSWGEFRGAVGILYEQARIAENAVRQPAGTLTTYREAVHHQAVSSLANLRTLHRHRLQLLQELLEEKRLAVDPAGPWAGRTFAVLPTANRGRLRSFLAQMDLQGFEVYRATRDLEGLAGVDQLGRSFADRTLPAGTVLVPSRQPQAPLVSTMLELDRPMPADYLSRERDSLLRSGDSTIYDVTAWNLTMMHGLEAVELEGDLPAQTERLDTSRFRTPGDRDASTAPAGSADPPVAWAVDGSDDRTVAVAARLMEHGVRVRVADEAFELGGEALPRGSLLVLPADNVSVPGDLAARLSASTAELGLTVVPLSEGLGDGDLPDIGGGHFTLLEPPRIAIATRGTFSSVNFGEIWHLLDRTLGIRHSHLEADSLDYADLRRYNVLVLPDLWYGSLGEETTGTLKTWVEAGGTLIAVAGAARELVGEESTLSGVRRLPDVLDRLDAYELAVLSEWMAQSSELPPTERVWSHTVGGELDFPWSELEGEKRPEPQEIERRDAWQRQFMPQGAMLAARTDPKHWLTFGTGATLPVLYLAGYYGNAGVLMADRAVEAPVRFGVLSPAGDAAGARRAGWGPVPAGHDLHLRMSGLLWPEAAARIANSAFVTRERRGNGQVILFATSPTFRGATLGTARIFMNALVFGPGFGARHPVVP